MGNSKEKATFFTFFLFRLRKSQLVLEYRRKGENNRIERSLIIFSRCCMYRIQAGHKCCACTGKKINKIPIFLCFITTVFFTLFLARLSCFPTCLIPLNSECQSKLCFACKSPLEQGGGGFDNKTIGMPLLFHCKEIQENNQPLEELQSSMLFPTHCSFLC